MIHPIPYMEVETPGRVPAPCRHPKHERERVLPGDGSCKVLDMTIPFSVQTPQWANYIPLTVNYTKRVGGQHFGMGRNGSICNASITSPPTWTGRSTSGRLVGPSARCRSASGSAPASLPTSPPGQRSSVYTPQMIESVVEVREETSSSPRPAVPLWLNSPDSDEFRYMIKHPAFARLCAVVRGQEAQVAGVDAVSQDHP